MDLVFEKVTQIKDLLHQEICVDLSFITSHV